MLGDSPCVIASTTGCKCPTVRLTGRAPHPPSWSEKRARSFNLFDANKVEECLSKKLTEAGDYGGSEVCGAIYHTVCRQASHKFPAWCGCLQGGLPAVVSCTYCDPDIDTDCSWRMPLLRCAQSSTQRSMSSNLLHKICQNGCSVVSKSGQTPTCSPCANAKGALPPENIDQNPVVHPAGSALLGGVASREGGGGGGDGDGRVEGEGGIAGGVVAGSVESVISMVVTANAALPAAPRTAIAIPVTAADHYRDVWHKLSPTEQSTAADLIFR